MFYVVLTEEEGEVFQVKKSSHSKKVMRMMDKERRKKKHRDHDDDTHTLDPRREWDPRSNNNGAGRYSSERDGSTSSASKVKGVGNDDYVDKRQKSSNAPISGNHTEIRTDDFVVRLLLHQVPYVFTLEIFTAFPTLLLYRLRETDHVFINNLSFHLTQFQ